MTCLATLPLDATAHATLPCCPLVLACDRAYAMPLATALRSAADNNLALWPLAVTVLHEGFDPKTRNAVLGSLPPGAMNVRWMPVDLRAFGEFGRLGHVSRMTFARLQISAVFARECSRVLYLDADTLVLGDLSALMNAPLDGASLGAVPDHHVECDRRHDLAHRTPGIPAVRRYFNAGVLLIDIAACRERRVAERALDYLRTHPHSPYADQDALNAACDDDWTMLDGRWNFQDHHKTPLARIPHAERPAIVHFITSSKPWTPRSGSVNAAFYDTYRRRTRFARSPLERARNVCNTFGWRVRRRLERPFARTRGPASLPLPRK